MHTTVKIVGGNFDNHGDHLMLIGAVLALRSMKPEPLLVSGILGFDTYLDRAKLGLYQTLWRKRGFRLARIIGEPVLRRYAHPFGIIPDDQVDAVLDMSGYAYADRWGVEPCKVRLAEYSFFKQRDVPIVFLPQAFGPFSPEGPVASVARSLVQMADRVYARERSSLEALQALCNGNASIALAPEFSQLVACARRAPFEITGDKRVAIVPNIQMVKQNEATSYVEYIGFLQRVITAVRGLNWTPVLLQFSRTADSPIVDDLVGAHEKLEVVWSRNPRILKRVIGECYGAVCCRYHSLVSALSQGVPALATSWSHKYNEMLRDYGIHHNVLNTTATEAALRDRLADAFETRREEVCEELKRRARENASGIHAMWSEVAEILGLTYEPHMDGDADQSIA